MKTLSSHLFVICYRALLQLYPADFRQVFAAEMRLVFSDGLDEAAAQGRRSLLAFFSRELVDLPAALLHAYRSTGAQRRRDAMSVSTPIPIQATPSTHADLPHPGTWREAALAAFPHLFWGIVIGLGKLDQVIFSRSVLETLGYLYVPIAILFFLLTASVLLFAWKRGWPVWSATWYGYAAWGVVVCISLANELLGLTESWIFNNAFILLSLLAMLLGYLALFRRDRLKALLAAFFLLPVLSTATLEFVPDPVEGLLGLLFGLSAALASGWIVRLGAWRFGLGLALALNLLAGVFLSYVSVYLAEFPGASSPPHLGEAIAQMIAYLIVSLIVFTGPWFLWKAWDRTRSGFA
jgi:hypothetical protein